MEFQEMLMIDVLNNFMISMLKCFDYSYRSFVVIQSFIRVHFHFRERSQSWVSMMFHQFFTAKFMRGIFTILVSTKEYTPVN